ncbi:MAG: MBL fold metallo-hydrolase, partial [Cryomorphaceae bacterium]
PYIDYKGHTLIYAADLLPSAAHIPMPYIMGYDVRPLETLKDKKIFLNDAAVKDQVIFFEHDIDNECIRVQETEKGIRLKEAHTFLDIFGN